MKSIRYLSAAACLFSVAPCLRAVEAPPAQALTPYLESLQMKLDHAAERANRPTAEGSNVAGVRGAQQEPMSKQLYWKGRNGEASASVDEVRALRIAVEQAQLNKRAEALATLKSFQEKYPHSALLPDVQDLAKRLDSGAPANP